MDPASQQASASPAQQQVASPPVHQSSRLAQKQQAAQQMAAQQMPLALGAHGQMVMPLQAGQAMTPPQALAYAQQAAQFQPMNAQQMQVFANQLLQMTPQQQLQYVQQQANVVAQHKAFAQQQMQMQQAQAQKYKKKPGRPPKSATQAPGAAPKAKRNKSPYDFFFPEYKADFISKSGVPQYKGERPNVDFKELRKEAKNAWEALTEAEKEPYVTRSAAQKMSDDMEVRCSLPILETPLPSHSNANANPNP